MTAIAIILGLPRSLRARRPLRRRLALRPTPAASSSGSQAGQSSVERRSRFVCAAALLLVEPPLGGRLASASSAGAGAATSVASRSCSTIRSVASSRLRSWERSSCAIDADDRARASRARAAARRRSVPPRPRRRRAPRRASSSSARAGRPARSSERSGRRLPSRIDSTSMAAILLDVDGVLHVSGEPIAGAAAAVRRLRERGHRLRFVTNSTTRSRAQLVEQPADDGDRARRRGAADDRRGRSARPRRASGCSR